jgi:hypothetical protein
VSLSLAMGRGSRRSVTKQQQRTMKSLIYSLLPNSVIQAIRRRRDKARRYKLAVRDNGRIYGTYVDPI